MEGKSTKNNEMNNSPNTLIFYISNTMKLEFMTQLIY